MRSEMSGAHVAGDPARSIDELLGSLPGLVVEISGWIGEVADAMARAVSAAMNGLLAGGGGATGPADEPVIPSAPVPAAPPTGAPVPAGGPTYFGGSSSSLSGFSHSGHDKVFQLFAVLILFSLAPLQDGERRRASREAFWPSMLARPPNERPD
jgi:hypothetical protein